MWFEIHLMSGLFMSLHPFEEVNLLRSFISLCWHSMSRRMTCYDWSFHHVDILCDEVGLPVLDGGSISLN